MIKQFRDTYYFISDEGKVFSNKYNNMKELKPNKNKYGYLYCSLKTNKQFKTFKYHRLVAECFLENYLEELDINHIDGNKQNNNINNLECITRKENIHHYWKSINGENWKPLTQEELKEYQRNYQKEYFILNKHEIKKSQKEYKKSEKYKEYQRNYKKNIYKLSKNY